MSDILDEIDPDRLPLEMREIWDRWRAEEAQLKEMAVQERIEEKRVKKKEKDAQRDKDFADAVEKVSRAGYVGKHGSFPVPEPEKWTMESWRRQAENGDYDTRKDSTARVTREIVELWKEHRGVNRIDAQRRYIRLANELITKYGWNPPPGWR